jgi:DNA-directed RNA polymerase subunit RPC12/RpoP
MKLVDYRCPCGHIVRDVDENDKRRSRCPECGGKMKVIPWPNNKLPTCGVK